MIPRQFFDERTQRMARPTPVRPEIDQHWHVAGGIDDVGLEAGIGAFADEIGGNRGGARGTIKGQGHVFHS